MPCRHQSARLNGSTSALYLVHGTALAYRLVDALTKERRAPILRWGLQGTYLADKRTEREEKRRGERKERESENKRAWLEKCEPLFRTGSRGKPAFIGAGGSGEMERWRQLDAERWREDLW